MFWDCHTHSVYSDDAEDTMTRLATSAEEHGLDGLCFTDHVDLDDTNGVYNPAAWRPDELLPAFHSAVQAARGRVALRLGIELGEGNHYPGKAAEIAAAVPDFIIGSVHNLRNTPDFYLGAPCGMYADEAHCRALLSRYVAELGETVKTGCFDVLGHIGYPLRYMRPAGYPDLTLEPCRDELTELFRALVPSGKGIELNTSGLRGNLCETMPAPWLLRLYRECGGEIVTLGSDSHRISDVGAGIKEGKKLLKDLGFEYYCVYNGRKAEFIKTD